MSLTRTLVGLSIRRRRNRVQLTLQTACAKRARATSSTTARVAHHHRHARRRRSPRPEHGGALPMPPRPLPIIRQGRRPSRRTHCTSQPRPSRSGSTGRSSTSTRPGRSGTRGGCREGSGSATRMARSTSGRTPARRGSTATSANAMTPSGRVRAGSASQSPTSAVRRRRPRQQVPERRDLLVAGRRRHRAQRDDRSLHRADLLQRDKRRPVASDSDEPYVIFGMVSPAGATTAVTREYADVDSGESPPDLLELYRGKPRGLTIAAS